jgi:DNA-binding IclR family transcriptional regulator
MKPTNQIPVLRKAVGVVEALAEGRGEPTAAALARTLALAPATAYRILQTLVHAGWVQQDADGRCALGLGLLPLLQRLQQHELLGPTVEAALQSLATATGVACKVSVREGELALTVMRADSPRPMALAVKAGARFHLALGSSGAVLLSGLPDAEIKRILKTAPTEVWQWQKPVVVWQRIREVRQQGVTLDWGSYSPDIFGISAPLLDFKGNIQGALTLTGLRHGHTKQQIERWRKLVLQTAQELNLGRRPIP